MLKFKRVAIYKYTPNYFGMGIFNAYSGLPHGYIGIEQPFAGQLIIAKSVNFK
jgi:hypothetical protein